MKTEALRKFEKVCEIIDRHGRSRSKLIPILQEVQEEYRYLPQEIMTFIATTLNISPAKVYGVATFYSHFALTVRGKYIIRVCDGTACHVKKSHGLLEAMRTRLKLSETKHTTDDMMFTIETVSCLGACGLAPVMVVNDAVHGQVTPARSVEIIEEIIKKESENDK
jgi:NADH-quinone oxidoreductase subunit E